MGGGFFEDGALVFMCIVHIYSHVRRYRSRLVCTVYDVCRVLFPVLVLYKTNQVPSNSTMKHGSVPPSDALWVNNEIRYNTSSTMKYVTILTQQWNTLQYQLDSEIRYNTNSTMKYVTTQTQQWNTFQYYQRVPSNSTMKACFSTNSTMKHVSVLPRGAL